MNDRNPSEPLVNAVQVYPASLMQLQFWFLHKYDPASPAYNVPSISVIEGDLDGEALDAAINALSRRHQIFRTTFDIDRSGTLMQRVAPWKRTPLQHVDLRGQGKSIADEAVVEQAVTEEIGRPFDLAVDLPLRSKVFRIGERSYRLVITAHHIVFDLATKDLFAEELADEYKAALSGQAGAVLSTNADYRAFSLWQEDWMRSEQREKMEQAWRRYLEGMEPSLRLPEDRSGAAGPSRIGSIVPLRVSGALLERLASFCRKEEVTPFLVLLTAWALTLARWSGQKKLCVGVPFTNRRKDDFKRTMGCFVNILPLSLDLSDDPTMRETLRRVRSAMLQMHRMQELPYYHLVQLMRHGGRVSENSLFQAGFTFEHPMRLQLEGLEMQPDYMHPGGAQLDIFATFWQEVDAVVGRVEYDSSRFTSRTVERMSESLLATISEICGGAGRTGVTTMQGKAEYAGFARYQKELLQGPEGARLSAFWKDKLAGELPELSLPVDKRRPRTRSAGGGAYHFTIDGGPYCGMASLAVRSGVTKYSALLAVFQVLLMRYSSQEDLLIGAPMVIRRSREDRSTDGCIINPVVLRGTVSPENTYEELLQKTHQMVSEAFAHGHYPFQLLVEQLGPVRDMGRPPVFQVMFDCRNRRNPGESAGPLHSTGELNMRDFSPEQEGQCDLSLELIDTGQSLSGLLKYSADLYEEATIARMAGHFQTLLQGILARPDQRLGELPLLTQQERHQLLVEWNNTGSEYPDSACIHDLFAVQAERAPKAVAVEYEERRLTYAELDALSSRFADYLKSLGVGPEVLVALYVDRSLEMVVALLGILKAGGAYLPLDRIFPRERLAFMLADAKPPVLVTLQKFLGELPSHQATVVCVDAFPAAAAPQAGAARPGSDNLAYVLYTSGSTGNPKGVEIPHRAVVNFLDSMRREPGMSEHDTLLSVTTMSFDILGLEIWLPLTTGAKVVLAPQETVTDGKRLAMAMTRSSATVMQATPATWRLLLESGWEGNPRLKILCGGEAWSQELARPLLAKCASLWNMYGPTETTIWSTVSRVRDGAPVSLGRPIANTQFYIVDKHLQPLPRGASGELLIGGDGLARAYLHRPDLTAQKFIVDPFSDRAGARVYRTGDLVRYLPDGNLEYLVRLDNQVKIRGFRIEIGEIEAVLAGHEAVRQAVVMAREDTPGDKQLAAYIIPNADRNPSISVLRRYLREKLPEYMVPSTFTMLEKFPLTPNGKIDRRALPAPASRRPELESAYMAPRTETERTITTLWQEVLQLEKIGVNDNFFDLGGNSLRMVQVHAGLREQVQRELSMLEMFTYPTINSLAAYLSRERNERLGSKTDDDREEQLKEGRSRMQQRFRQREKAGQKERNVKDEYVISN